ncbi:MAG TPA: serine--tRNA ligase, partial [Verrucomicrobiae bacterium]
MFDVHLIREQPDLVRESLRRRGDDPARVDAILAADEERRTQLSELEAHRNQRNVGSKEIGRMKDDAERQSKVLAMGAVNARIQVLEGQVNEIEARLNDLLAVMPNIPADDVPFGKDDGENVVIRTMGEPRKFEFTPIPHWDLGPALGIIDFERGIRLAGSRFYVLAGAGARLQRAVIQWMLDVHVSQGYREVYLPFMVREAVVFASGQLPKFRDNLYHDIERDAWMVPTAEVPLTSLHAGEIIDGKQLPLNYVAYTPCFRKEAMSAGKDVRG